MPIHDTHLPNSILKNILSYQTSASERNAEWEVGDNGGYVVDGEWRLKR